MANISWNNTRKMIIRMIMVFATMILMCINVITVKAETKTVTYNANGGTFDGGGTTNVVTYDAQLNMPVTKYSHTSNLSDDGTQNGSYPNNANTNEVVTIPGAEELEVTITYSGESASWDWACVWEGNRPEYTASSNSSSSISGKLGGSRNTQTYTISGDSVTFGFKSDSSGTGDGYGYYAVITGIGNNISTTSGEEKTPTSDNAMQVFECWNTQPDGNGTNLSFKEAAALGGTVFAKYKTLQNIAEGDWWSLREDGLLTIGNGGTITVTGDDHPWHSYKDSIKNIKTYGTIKITGSMQYYFYNHNNVMTVNLSGFDTSDVTSMTRMFSSCTSLTSIELGDNFDTSNVTDMGSMFTGSTALTSLDLGNKFDTSNVTDMGYMFSECKALVFLNLGNKLDSTKVRDMSNMFYNCNALTLLNLGDKFDTSNVANMANMFSNCKAITSLDLGDKFDTSKVTNMSYMFYGCNSITSLDLGNKFNTSNVTNMAGMFTNCRSLTTLNLGDKFDTSSVTNMQNMFSGCQAITSLDLGDKFDTSNATDISGMFAVCEALTSLDIGDKFNTSKVTRTAGMFNGCQSLTSLDLGDKFDTSSVTDMTSMFNKCQSLTSLDLGDKFDTSNVTEMGNMFRDCQALTSLNLEDKFDTSIVTNMEYMFENCKSLTSLDLGDKFDTSSVTAMGNMVSSMFSGDTKLSSITLNPKFSFRGNGSAYCVLPTPPASTTTGKWIRADGTSDAYTPADLRDNFDSLPAGVKAGEWVWEELSTKYTITFAANPSNASGSMPQVKTQAAESFTIPANQFVMRRHVFDHWEDGQGHTYQNNGTIPANTYAAGANITLTAVLVDSSSAINFTNGEAEFDLYANEKLTFDNIPAGTAYQVYEETPEGWVLIEQSNTSGIIQPLETADARFNNKYQPGTATIQFSGSKTLDNNAASEDAFTFILKEDNVEIDRKSTMNGGFIQFDVIEYTDADVGTHSYTIEEVNPDNDKLIWDTHKESITVEVNKTGSQLSAEATYDSDGIVFKNYTKPGILKIKKETEGTTEANANDEFTFNVALNNDKGMPIDNDVQWYKEAS